MERQWEETEQNEVWKYGREEVENWLGEICKKVWSGEGWPRDWRDGQRRS